MSQAAPLLAVRRLTVTYPLTGTFPWQAAGVRRAVDGVDFNLSEGETLGIVGESGCGKSSLARALVGLQDIASGAVEYQGQQLNRLSAREWRPWRRDIQFVFQDPAASLDPRMVVDQIIEEPLEALCPEMDRGARMDRVEALLDQVGLPRAVGSQYPHELSGGQAQRVAIARALAVMPKVLICDEVVSALDVSVQAQIINLLARLQRQQGLALVFIAHDLAVVRHLCQRILVMYRGRVVEQGALQRVFDLPAHPYTRALLAAMPEDEGDTDPEAHAQRAAELMLPDPGEDSSETAGCVFVLRCPMADERCTRQIPYLRRVGHGGHAACHYVGTTDQLG
jgi:oligopeptide transport system ATP-binding protein